MGNVEIGTVLVTGGASGLGAAVARAVQLAGGTPVVLDRVTPASDADHEVVDLVDGREAEAAAGRVLVGFTRALPRRPQAGSA